MRKFVADNLSDIHADIVTAMHDLGDGETLLSFDRDRVREFCCTLSELSWKEIKHFSLGNTNGTFYEHESGRTMYVYTNAGVGVGCAVLGAKMCNDDTYIGEQIYSDTLFYQVYNDPQMGGGMTYLIRMKDGRFVIIDGGFNLDAEGLIKVMTELHPRIDACDTFEIAAWIVTHPHDDHISLLKKLTSDSTVMSRLHIKRMYANCPCSDTLRVCDKDAVSDNDWMRVCFDMLRAHGCEIVKPYAGMSVRIGELTMRVFFTQAEWHFVDMKTVNDASMVLTFSRDGGKNVMILGDIMDGCAKYLMKMYTPDQLHADAVQVAHHALIGPDITLYEAIKPKICLWPINLKGYEYTQYPTITERNDKLREMDVINCIACFGSAQIVI